MSEHEDRYNEIIRRARRENLRDLIERTETQFFRELIKAFEQDFGQRLPPDPESFIAAYLRSTRRLQSQTVALINEVIQRSATLSRDAHIEAHRSLERLDDQTLTQVLDALDGVPDRAIQATFARRSLGSVDAFKSLQRWPSSSDTIEQAIADMIREGESYTRAAQNIMRGLTQGDQDLARIANTYGPNGGLRRWAQDAGITPNPEARSVARRLGYDAKRIARTETAQSYHEADRLSAMESPVTRGLKWTLSPNHPVYDICDVYAGQDVYGLGAGVYPPSKVPTLPHPHCLCSTRYVFKDEDEWGTDTEEPSIQTPPGEQDIDTDKVSEAHKRRILDQLSTSIVE